MKVFYFIDFFVSFKNWPHTEYERTEQRFIFRFLLAEYFEGVSISLLYGVNYKVESLFSQNRE